MNGAPQYSAVGFRRFVDMLTQHGLEMFGLFYGFYRAEVVANSGFTQGPNGSRDNQGLLGVRVPGVGDTSDTAPRTAYPMFPLAGPDYGLKNLPPVGSFTYVTFERGRLDMPLWLGGWFRADELPERLQSVDSYGWITPNGQKLVFDDAGNTYLEESNGQQVHLGAEADEDAVKGNTLLDLLNQTFDAITTLTVTAVGGQTTPPNNAAQFKSIQQQLETFLSKVVRLK